MDERAAEEMYQDNLYGDEVPRYNYKQQVKYRYVYEYRYVFEEVNGKGGYRLQKFPVATIAMRGYRFGVAVCSPKDRFQKEVGRRIALHRLDNEPYCFPRFRDREVIGIDYFDYTLQEFSLRGLISNEIEDMLIKESRDILKMLDKFDKKLDTVLQYDNNPEQFEAAEYAPI